MLDLRDQFRAAFDELDVPPLWERIEAIAGRRAVQRRRPAPKVLVAIAASLVALIAIGGPLLILRSGARSGSEEPLATWTFEPPSLVRRQLARVDLAGDGQSVDIQQLPAGGFVGVGASQGQVVWSPDGMQWFDADPDDRVTPYLPQRGTQLEDRAVTATADHVIIRDVANAAVWVGVLQSGQWVRVALERPDTTSRSGLLAVGAGQGTALLVSRDVDPSPSGGNDTYATWTINPSEGILTRTELLVGAEEQQTSWNSAIVERFAGTWLVLLPGDGSDTLLTSTDGVDWARQSLPQSFTSLTVGPSGAIATQCNFGGDTFWYSPDGVDWTATTSAYLGHQSTYAEGLGFVVAYESDAVPSVLVSEDGRQWDTAAALGLRLERYRADAGGDPANLFVFGSTLWQWTAE